MDAAMRIAPMCGGPSYVQTVSCMAHGDILKAPAAAAVQRARKQLREVRRLVETVHRRKHQLDGPFGAEPLGLERIGETEPADGQVRAVGAQAIELGSRSWPSLRRTPGAAGQFAVHHASVEIGHADLDQLHAAFARQEAASGISSCESGRKTDALAGELLAVAGEPSLGTGHGRGAVTLSTCSALMPQASAAAPSQARVPSMPNG
jgi:hypothetical protein